ncbi:two-component system, OmpR family, phosphate regulon sensor histidine kinase PhoR [Draconibacterium orientale]|jgi:two-component system phosphate regulon sensor histidine kinase PhoR|uniref:histidine kinase n=1 Tax=Draconibacterium orientale TaxID=1168034 RepID=X5D971_9BACT|nr:ATP-binding protein [Draconibacterium orientale]AHW59288.1 histidine kinase [Draconibacterium orientale]SET85125.1 two-component system, OmpR family, phosphate regulon sensor histidine kinase PhoR [Draconibacterium orientale]
MRTYSSKFLAILVAIVLTLLAFGIALLAHYFGENILAIIVSTIAFFAAAYFSILYIIKKYIIDRIRPLYNTIRDLPLSGKKMEEKIDSNSLLLNVKYEVEEWAKTQLKEIERLKELEKYRKDFVGNVSHELKTPIFNIQGYVLTLLEGGLEDPKINKLYLKRTEKSIDRMVSIVEDLESITKLESGELQLNMTRFDIVKTVEEVIEMEHWQASESQITVQIINKPDRPIFVRADKKRILEVVTNLIVNGVKYGKENGYVNISFHDLEDNIIVEVADNGIGIDKKDLRRIFERFFRVDKSRSREQGGTGLGLSIVKHIIEAHNQSINVRSVLDQGTTFNFTLEKQK